MDRRSRTGLGGAVLAALWLGGAQGAHAFTAYVTNEKGNSVTVIDTATMAVTATWKVGRRPRGITLSDAGRARVEACNDITTMDRWVARAVTISREVDLFAED